jgi:hypothetical protein
MCELIYQIIDKYNNSEIVFFVAQMNIIHIVANGVIASPMTFLETKVQDNQRELSKMVHEDNVGMIMIVHHGLLPAVH